MKKTLVCNLVGSIHDLLEQTDPKELELGSMGKKLLIVSDELCNSFLIADHNAPSALVHKKTEDVSTLSTLSTSDDDIEMVEDTDEPSFEEQLELAYDILRTETRHGPTLIERGLKIKPALARKLLKELRDQGRIVQGQRAADIDGLDSEEGALSEGFEPVETEEPVEEETNKKAPTLTELIADLPIGESLLVDDHFKYLLVLPEASQSLYLTGIKLTDVVTVEAVEEASMEGADRTIVDLIIAGETVKPKPVKDRLNLGDKSDKQMINYAGLRAKWVKGIPNGKDLYKLLAVNGINKRVLGDLRKIYQAVESGAV